MKNVTAQFGNSDGSRVSDLVTASILLDTVPPQLTVSSPTPESTVDLSGGAPIGIGGTVIDPGGSGVDYVTVANGGSDAVDGTVANGFWAAPLGARTSGRFVFTSTAVDRAGNPATLSTPVNLVVPPPDVTIVRPGVIDASALATQVVSSTSTATVFNGDQRPFLGDKRVIVMAESAALPYGLLGSIDSVAWDPGSNTTTVATGNASILDVYAQYEPPPVLPNAVEPSSDSCENFRNDATAGVIVDLPKLGAAVPLPFPVGTTSVGLDIDARLAIGVFAKLDIDFGLPPELKEGSYLKVGTLACAELSATTEASPSTLLGPQFTSGIDELGFQTDFGVKDLELGKFGLLRPKSFSESACKEYFPDGPAAPIPGPLPLTIRSFAYIDLCAGNLTWSAGTKVGARAAIGATIGVRKGADGFRPVLDPIFESNLTSLEIFADGEAKWEPALNFGVKINAGPPAPNLPSLNLPDWLVGAFDNVRAESAVGKVGLSIGPELGVTWASDRIAADGQRTQVSLKACADAFASIGLSLTLVLEVPKAKIPLLNVELPEFDVRWTAFDFELARRRLEIACKTIYDSSQPQTVNGGNLPQATRGVAYATSLSASAPATWSIVGGNLPAGLSLTPTGALTGTPTASGVSGFSARATFPSGATADGTFTITVNEPPTGGVGGGTAAVAIGAGDFSSCALTASGGVKCWGRNRSGQIGDGTTTQRLTPVDVIGLGSGVQTIANGSEHTCAITTGGAAKCWGLNGNGQLGDGTTTQRPTPVDVVGLGSGVKEISASDNWHTCALTTGGAVKCWGWNAYGALGDGTGAQRPTPVDVVGLGSGVRAITTGFDHTCALTTGGAVKCWGRNSFGELGDGTTATNRSTPVDVVGLGSGVQAISAGTFFTCALTTGGAVKCWGRNDNGQLGDGTTTTTTRTPVDVVGLGSGVKAIATGNSHACALTNSEAVKCWGLNRSGQLGDGTTTTTRTPVDVVGLGSSVRAVTAGRDHTCALTNSGAVKCWGGNGNGQLGVGNFTTKLTPADVAALAGG